MDPSVSSVARNRILGALPRSVRASLMPSFEPISLHIKEVLSAVHAPVKYIYFVVSGVASLIPNAEGDDGIEVATVGNEGMLGLPAFLGAETAAMRVFVHVPGEALRMPVETFRKQCACNEDLTNVLLRYTQALMTQIAQSSACNRLHPIEQRCARWLLMTHDRVEGDEFPMTQEFLSKMLGARRASVNVTANALQRAGLIQYKRGVITVVDRDRLESAACECYGIVAAEYERLFRPSSVRRRSTKRMSEPTKRGLGPRSSERLLPYSSNDASQTGTDRRASSDLCAGFAGLMSYWAKFRRLVSANHDGHSPKYRTLTYRPRTGSPQRGNVLSIGPLRERHTGKRTICVRRSVARVS